MTTKEKASPGMKSRTDGHCSKLQLPIRDKGCLDTTRGWGDLGEDLITGKKPQSETPGKISTLRGDDDGGGRERIWLKGGSRLFVTAMTRKFAGRNGTIGRKKEVM